MNSNTQKSSGAIYTFPFILFFLVFGLAILHTDPHQETNTVNQILYSLAYISAFFILLSKQRHFLSYIIKKSPPLILIILLSILSILWSEFPRYVLVGFVHKIGSALIAICATSLLIQNKNKFFEVLLIMLFFYFLASIIFTYLRPDIALMPATLYGKYRAGMRGFTPHPNTLGGICVISLWVALTSLFLIDNHKRSISFLSTALLLFIFYCLIKADSMTSILVSIGMIIIIGWFSFIKSSSSGVLILKILFAITSIVISIIILFIVKPEFFTAEYFFKLIGRDASLTGRTSLWDMGLKGFYAKPLFGWSEDNLLTFLRTYRMSFGQLHNGYFDFLVRSGIVSMLLFLSMLFQIIKSLLTMNIYKNRSYVMILAFICPWLVHNITEASISKNTNLLWLVFLITYFFSVGYKYEYKNNN